MEPFDFVAYGLLPWYPHMSATDSVIWERYIRAYPKAFDRVSYDVAVGAGAEFDVTAGGILGPGIKKLYQRRIDVLGEKDSRLWIVEVKDRASTSAIGQILGYGSLFKRDHPEHANVGLRLVTNAQLPEMDFLLQKTGIEFIVV